MAQKTLPNNVRKLRESQLMSKAELARKAGLSPLTIDRVESGKPCRMDTKRKIILALGLKLTDRHKVFEDDEPRGERPAPVKRAKREHGGEGTASVAGPGDARTAHEEASPKGAKDEPAGGSDLPKARYS